MSVTVIQAGNGLAFVDEAGIVTPIPLPTGITLRTDVPPRWEVYGHYVVLVNTPSRPLTIDAAGAVRPLTPAAPRLAPILSGVPTGTLSGTYNHGRYTFLIRADDGTIIAESDYSPASSTDVVIVTEDLQYAGIDISPDNTVNARRMYRVTDGGADLFQWIDLDGNVLTSIQDDLPDAALSLLAASPALGAPPRLTLIAEFRNRLFGVGDLDVDTVRYTETGLMYAWPALNGLSIPRQGSDLFGVTAFLTRREALGVGRLNRILAIVGTGEESADQSTLIDFRVIIVSDQCGVVSQESVQVYRDKAYFLWHDGVYQWDDSGIVCLTDGTGGRGRVRTWFTTPDYFDASRFSEAFAQIDTTSRVKYRLFLFDPAGVLKFVEFDLLERTWDGPHRIDAFTAKSAFLRTVNNIPVPTVGGADGGIYDQGVRPTAADVALSGQRFGIDYDVDTKFYPNPDSTPDREQYFGQLSMLGAVQTAGVLTVTPKVGYLDAPAQPPIGYQMQRGRQRLRRLGFGKLAQLNLRHTKVDEPVALFGFEIDDLHEGGRR
jgi:hypothetical protein